MDGPARLAVHRGYEVSAAVAIVLLLTFTYTACRRALHWRWLIALSGTALLLLVAVLIWPHREVGRSGHKVVRANVERDRARQAQLSPHRRGGPPDEQAGEQQQEVVFFHGEGRG